MKGKRLTQDERNKIIRLYQQGVSYHDMERQVGRSAKTIRNILNQHKIPKRPYPSGENHHLWKGGRHKRVEGYIEVLLPPHHPLRSMAQSSGYIKEHRLIMAEHLGRTLETTEHVHHINGNKKDNRIENLQLVTHHGSGIRLQCRTCGSYDVQPVKFVRKENSD